MKSKISCFNKTIFKKNLTLYWPLWTAWLLLLFAAIPVNLYQYMRMYENDPLGRQYTALRGVFSLATSPILIFTFCVFAVMCVFSYLYTVKNANGIHGLPVTRLELFVTNSVSAFTCLAIPELLSFIAGVFVGVSCGVTHIEILLYTFLFQLGITFFGVAFASAITMLTGHIMAMPVYCFIANYLYVIIRAMIESLFINLTYGLNALWDEDITYILSPLYYLTQEVTIKSKYNQALDCIDTIIVEGGGAVAGYAAAGIVLFIVAYQLYKRRHLETAGDVISVGFMKPVFRIGLGVFGGTTLGIIISELFYFNTVRYSNARFTIMLFFILVCVLVGYFMAEMLMQKSFRIFKKRILTEAGISVAAVTVFLFAVNADMFGLEKMIPNKDEITEVWADLDYPVKYEGEEIEELLAVHEQIVAEKDLNLEAIKNSTGQRSSVNFKYVLKNGSVVSRSYTLPIDMENPANPEMASGKIIAKEMEAERIKQYALGMNYESNQYVSGYINLYDQYRNHFEYRFSEEEIARISEALLKDMEEGNYAYYTLNSARGIDFASDEFTNELRLAYFNEEGIERIEDRYYAIPMDYNATINGAGTWGDYAVAESATSSISFLNAVDSDSFYAQFGKQCTNLVQTLEELGIVNETWHLYTHNEYDALQVDKK